MANASTKVQTTAASFGSANVCLTCVVLSVAVSRIRAHSDMYEMDLLLDINSDLYPVEVRPCATNSSQASSISL